MGKIIVLTEDDETPSCIKCDHLTEILRCMFCGEVFEWANYERSVEVEEN